MLCLGRAGLEPRARDAGNGARAERSESCRRRHGRALGAWITVARVLLNLDEFVTRE